jgi:multidrug efflux pump subunit AcrB
VRAVVALALLLAGCRATEKARAGVVIEVTRAASAEANEEVVIVLERAAMGVQGITSLESEADDRGGRVIAWFADGERAEAALFPLREAIAGAVPRLPPDADAPVLRRTSPGTILAFVLAGPAPLAELAEVNEETVVQPLLTTPGVRGAEVCGPGRRETQVLLDAERLVAYGLTVADVAAALAGAPDPTAAKLPRDLRLTDVAVLETRSAPGGCVAFENGQPVIATRIDGEATATKAALARLAERTPSLPPAFGLRSLGPGTDVVVEVPAGASEEQRVRLGQRAAATLRDADRVVLEVPRSGELRLHVEGAANLAALAQLPDVHVRVRGEELWITLLGDDARELAAAAERVRERLATLEGVTGTGLRGRERGLLVEYEVDRQRAADLGVSLGDVGTTLATLGDGKPMGRVRLRVVPPTLGLRVRGKGEALIPLEALVQSRQRETGALLRRDGRRAILVWATAADRRALRKPLEAMLQGLDLPAGITPRLDPP